MKFKSGKSTFIIHKSRFYDTNKIGITNEFLKKLPENFDNIGETIYAARNQIKVVVLNGHKINIKKYCIPPIINRIFYSIGLRTPKCVSAFINAEKILNAGFETPRPYAYILEKRNGLIYYSYFISDQFDDFKQLRACKGISLIKEFAVYTAKLHEKGLSSRDYTPGNILCNKENGKWHFILIDVNRFSFKGKPLNISQAPYNLYTSYITRSRLKYLARCYGEYRGMDTDYLINKTLFLRTVRNMYSFLKRKLKKIPGASKFTLKPIKKND